MEIDTHNPSPRNYYRLYRLSDCHRLSSIIIDYHRSYRGSVAEWLERRI